MQLRRWDWKTAGTNITELNEEVGNGIGLRSITNAGEEVWSGKGRDYMENLQICEGSFHQNHSVAMCKGSGVGF